MRWIGSIAGAGLLLGLAACAPEEVANQGNAAPVAEEVPANVVTPENIATVNQAAAEGPGMALAPDGLMLVDMTTGSTRQIAFGTPREQAMQMVALAEHAPGSESSNDECGGGPLAFADYPGGLKLVFEDGKFAGWSVDERASSQYTTMNGIGVGSSRAELEAAGDFEVRDTTLGHEFTLGELGGLLGAKGPTGKVTNLWAGMTCLFR